MTAAVARTTVAARTRTQRRSRSCRAAARSLRQKERRGSRDPKTLSAMSASGCDPDGSASPVMRAIGWPGSCAEITLVQHALVAFFDERENCHEAPSRSTAPASRRRSASAHAAAGAGDSRYLRGIRMLAPAQPEMHVAALSCPSDAANWPPALRRAYASSLRHAAFTACTEASSAQQAAVQDATRPARAAHSPYRPPATARASPTVKVARQRPRRVAPPASSAAGTRIAAQTHARCAPASLGRRAMERRVLLSRRMLVEHAVRGGAQGSA
jgi:hypothetical protein